MMEIIKPGINIDFVGKLKIFFAASFFAVVISVGLMVTKGFNLGIDFAGGTVIQVEFSESLTLDAVRNGIAPAIGSDFVLQNIGDDNKEVIIRITENPEISLQELSDGIKAQLAQEFAAYNPQIHKTEQVGPQVGEELRKKAFLALIYASIGILIYVAIRFQWLFGLGAIVSLVHDIIITMGIYSLIGKEFNITVMAALLTVAGYSLNDTIVVFDRIREKIKTGCLNEMGWKELVNMSVNETLSRTILTSFLTFLAVLSLYLFGGEVINGFALIMLVGIFVGTYSSIAIATMFVYVMRKDKLEKVSDGKKLAKAK